MSSINKLEMASALLKNSHISIHKSFFGLKQKAIYVPTSSKLTVMVNEYDNENAALVENILNTEDARLENEIRRSGVIIAHWRTKVGSCHHSRPSVCSCTGFPIYRPKIQSSYNLSHL